MSQRETIYYTFYTICFTAAVYFAITIPRINSHIPPPAFAIELFALPIGFVIFQYDIIKYKKMTVHKIGLTANGLVMAYILFMAF